MSSRILVADDHAIVREGLRSLLVGRGYEVVAAAADGQETVDLARTLGPDVVILDVAMPRLNGIEATRKMIERSPQLKVIVLSMHTASRFVIEAVRAGASAYLPKETAFDELCGAIEAVERGDVYLSPRITGPVVHQLLSPATEAPLALLTPREREIVQLLAEGQSAKEIAFALGISAKTVDTHRQQAMDKLGVRSIAELTKLAVREGLTGP